jgi:hypothetical protein
MGAALLVLSGCATLFASKSKEIPLVSEPQAAEVLLDGNRVGLTPMTLKIDNGKSQVVTFRKAGYKDVSCQLNAKTGAGWVVLDILGGLIPIIIDAATGDWKQVKETNCTVTLPVAQE